MNISANSGMPDPVVLPPVPSSKSPLIQLFVNYSFLSTLLLIVVYCTLIFIIQILLILLAHLQLFDESAVEVI